MSAPALDDLALFVRVIDRGSFASAARELGVPTSTVSRAIARLESDARVRLLQRTTRTLRPTPEGRALYEQIGPAVSTLRAATRAIESSNEMRGRLRISAPVDIGATFLARTLAEYAARHPAVSIEVSLTNTHASLVEEDFDVAVRAAARLASSSLVARKIGEIEHRLYASPAYLERHRAPRTPAELQGHALVLFRAEDQMRTWQLRGRSTETSLRVRGRISSDELSFVRAMVLAGAGIGLMPFLSASADEAAGRLVRVLPALHAKGATLYVLHPSAKHVPARVAAFRDLVVTSYARWLAEP